MSTEAIEVEATKEPETTNQMAVATIQGGSVALARPLPLDEIHKRLEFVRQVMQTEMKEGQDYGKIPGAGDKPSLLQPGAQKLLLTFQLREQVKKEVLREYPGFHREYEFTVTVFPAGGSLDDGWDGVGTCSTLESKYRYRKATRACPECGKEAIIVGKEEYGGGFVCYKKKGGCGAKFHDQHPAIISQSVEDVENEDPADQWNTVRKMAFKRALVAAAINATNTSELWTQDVEDMAENKGKQTAKDSQNAPGRNRPPTDTGKGVKASPGASREAVTGNKSPSPGSGTPSSGRSPTTITPQQAIFADSQTRERMISMFKESADLLHEYFVKAGCLLETERLEDLPLRFVPVTRRQAKALQDAMADFGNGAAADMPYPPNPEPEPVKGKNVTKSDTAPRGTPPWFWDIVCPIPHRGEKRDAYLKHPDTIESLYKAMKDGDQEAQKRLWGFAKHWTPSERQVGNKTYPISKEDELFREALDAFVEWDEKRAEDTRGEEAQGEFPDEPRERISSAAAMAEKEDDVPF